MHNFPETPLELSRLLARRLGTAATTLGFAAGGISYQSDTRRAELATLERAVAGARHFETPAMQMAASINAPKEHGALKRLLDRTRFVGIRVFSPDRVLIYETWTDVPAALINTVRSRQHASVSYTHLDVYKRQPYCNPVDMLQSASRSQTGGVKTTGVNHAHQVPLNSFQPCLYHTLGLHIRAIGRRYSSKHRHCHNVSRPPANCRLFFSESGQL